MAALPCKAEETLMNAAQESICTLIEGPSILYGRSTVLISPPSGKHTGNISISTIIMWLWEWDMDGYYGTRCSMYGGWVQELAYLVLGCCRCRWWPGGRWGQTACAGTALVLSIHQPTSVSGSGGDLRPPGDGPRTAASAKYNHGEASTVLLVESAYLLVLSHLRHY